MLRLSDEDDVVLIQRGKKTSEDTNSWLPVCQILTNFLFLLEDFFTNLQ